MPISLIWGEEDTITPISQGEELVKTLDPVKFTRPPDTGHMPQLENPMMFNQILLERLQEIQSLNADKTMQLRTKTLAEPL